MVFYSTFFPCVAEDYTRSPGIAPTRPVRRAPVRLPPCSPALRRSRATGPLKTQKGGKISPAARRFPLSPFREAVKPPLLVPVFRDRPFCVGEFLSDNRQNRQNPRFRFANDSEDRYITSDDGYFTRNGRRNKSE